MNITLKTLRIKNFKGIANKTIDFSQITDISGENGTGKTSIFDAFTWLLFDKDSQDRAKFDIQPLDENNNIIHRVDTEVEAILVIDGAETTLTKILREKWVKKRGEADSELKGTEASYFVNEVPQKQGEYKKKISEIVNENIFKLITNPLYFSITMKWQDRRNIILNIVDVITDERIIASSQKLKGLDKLLNKTTIEDLKKATAAKKKKLAEEKKGIPPRVDELNSLIKEHDFKALELQEKTIKETIKNIEDKLMDSSKAGEAILQEQQKLFNLKSKLNILENEARREAEKPKEALIKELNEVNTKIVEQNYNSSVIEGEIKIKTSIAETIEKEVAGLRIKFAEVNKTSLEFSENDFICPTCKRPLETENIELLKNKLTESYNQNKIKQLTSIREEGQKKAEELKKVRERLEILNNDKVIGFEAKKAVEAKKADLENKIISFTAEIDISQITAVEKEIKELEEKLQEPSKNNNQELLKNKRAELQADLQEVNKGLAAKKNNEEYRGRMTELLEEEKALAQKIADLEKTEYMCEEFTKAKVNLMEESINSKFKFVKFKLFNVLVNGGIEETCEALINGVPFSNANKASQYNAGVDIINALSGFYNVHAPIFIDNRESVNNLIESNSQIVNLLVSKDKNLLISEVNK